MIKEDPVRKAVCLIAFSLFVFAFSVATAQKTGKTEIAKWQDGKTTAVPSLMMTALPINLKLRCL